MQRHFEQLTSTGSLFFFIWNYLDATKFVFLSVFTIIETICPKIEENRRPKMKKKTTNDRHASLKNVFA